MQEVAAPLDNRHADSVAIDVSLVGRLVAAQFPQWADLPIRPVEFDGWDNRTFRLGKVMSVRLPSAGGYAAQVDKEHRWLPRLGPHLPLPIPVPLAKGEPGEGYPWPWSVYGWLDGEHATLKRIADLHGFASALAGFLVALQRIDPTGGPAPGPHNFFRGGPLTVYDAETRSDRCPTRQDRRRGGDRGVGHGPAGDVAWPAGVGPRRRRGGESLSQRWTIECGHRLREFGRGRSCVPRDDRVDALGGRKPRGVPRGTPDGPRDVGAGSGLGTVEGLDHPGWESGYRPRKSGRGAASH